MPRYLPYFLVLAFSLACSGDTGEVVAPTAPDVIDISGNWSFGHGVRVAGVECQLQFSMSISQDGFRFTGQALSAAKMECPAIEHEEIYDFGFLSSGLLDNSSGTVRFEIAGGEYTGTLSQDRRSMEGDYSAGGFMGKWKAVKY